MDTGTVEGMIGVGIFQRAKSAGQTLVIAGALAAGTMSLTDPASAQSRAAGMAIDANTGEVLYAQSADEPRFPASLTKMMTLYIMFGEIEAGRLAYDSPIRISEAATSVAPSKLDLDAGSNIALIDAMKALITKSANDIAVALAEHVAGNEVAFARLMTERARQIGMRSTTFRNASGLPDPDQVTTARDMLTLALRLHDDYPKQYRLFSLKYFTYRGDTHRNHNSLLFNYSGVEGIKTGYTRASGFNLVSSVKRDGKHVVAAVFGGTTAGSRNAHMRSILTRVLAKASPVRTRRPAPLLIARPMPVARPAVAAVKAMSQPAPRPAPVVAATSPPAPPRIATPVATSHAAPIAIPAPVVAPAPAMPAPPTPKFEIAMVKVRPSMPPAPAEPAAQQPVMASLAPKLDFQALQTAISGPRETAPAATAPPAMTETIIAKSNHPTGVRTPGTLDQQLAVFSDNASSQITVPPPQPVAMPPAARPIAAAARPVPMALGAPPSTLGAQAARLAGNAPPMPQHFSGPASAKSGYEIQIGAFATAAEAEARMAAVQRQSAVVNGHTAMALPVQDGARMMYRARFAGFDGPRATSACIELRRSGVDCFVSKTD